MTGKSNYIAFGIYLGGQPIAANPDSVATDKDLAIKSSTWFWNRHNLNSLADKADLVGITRAINGGLNGLAGRMALYNTAMVVL